MYTFQSIESSVIDIYHLISIIKNIIVDPKTIKQMFSNLLTYRDKFFDKIQFFCVYSLIKCFTINCSAVVLFLLLVSFISPAITVIKTDSNYKTPSPNTTNYNPFSSLSDSTISVVIIKATDCEGTYSIGNKDLIPISNNHYLFKPTDSEYYMYGVYSKRKNKFFAEKKFPVDEIYKTRKLEKQLCALVETNGWVQILEINEDASVIKIFKANISSNKGSRFSMSDGNLYLYVGSRFFVRRGGEWIEFVQLGNYAVETTDYTYPSGLNVNLTSLETVEINTNSIDKYIERAGVENKLIHVYDIYWIVPWEDKLYIAKEKTNSNFDLIQSLEKVEKIIELIYWKDRLSMVAKVEGVDGLVIIDYNLYMRKFTGWKSDIDIDGLVLGVGGKYAISGVVLSEDNNEKNNRVLAFYNGKWWKIEKLIDSNNQNSNSKVASQKSVTNSEAASFVNQQSENNIENNIENSYTSEITNISENINKDDENVVHTFFANNIYHNFIEVADSVLLERKGEIIWGCLKKDFLDPKKNKRELSINEINTYVFCTKTTLYKVCENISIIDEFNEPIFKFEVIHKWPWTLVVNNKRYILSDI